MSWRQNIKDYFFEADSWKPTIKGKKIAWISGVTFTVLVGYVAYEKTQIDDSTMKYSSDPIDAGEKPKETSTSNTLNGLFGSSKKKEHEASRNPSKKNRSHHTRRPINYKANQVILRKGDNLSVGLPIGINLVGKLLTAIDTRETSQLYKILLPYGGQDKNGGSIPKNSILFGKARYSGQGNKVFLQLSKALLPNGEELKINAQVLSSKDYSPGIIGEFHGRSLERTASTLGLTMVSAMAETLTEREALGAGNTNGVSIATEATPKATTRNALYQGISKVSQSEAKRQAQQLSSMEEFVTVPIGKELIVNLVETYKGAL